MRRFLIRAGASFAGMRQALLPLVLVRAAPNFWDDLFLVHRLERRAAVQRAHPHRLPVFDLADIRDISAEQAAVGSKTQVNTIGGRYGAATVVIAEAVVDLVTVSGQRNVYLSRYFGGHGQAVRSVSSNSGGETFCGAF